MAKKAPPTKVEDTRLKEYELIYILSPDTLDEAVDSRVEGINQFIAERNGVVGEVQKWGKRKLAYPLKNQLEGNYVLTRLQLSPTRCQELEASLKISEDILRHLLIKVGS